MIAYWKPFFSRIWRVFFFLSDTQKRSAHWDKYLLFVHKFNLHHSGPKFKGRKKIFLWYKIQIKSFFQNWIFGPKLDFCPSVQFCSFSLPIRKCISSCLFSLLSIRYPSDYLMPTLLFNSLSLKVMIERSKNVLPTMICQDECLASSSSRFSLGTSNV